MLLFIGAGLLVLILYIVYFVGATNIADLLTRVNPFLYIFAFIAFIMAVFFVSLTWHSLLRNLE